MIAPKPVPTRRAAEVDLPDTLNCPVCPHPIAGHDANDTRYCRATVVRARSRGCICTP